VFVGSIFEPDSEVQMFGCNDGRPERAVDNNINNFWCDRTGINNVTDPSFQVPGIILAPGAHTHRKTSIVKKLRLYPTQGCKGCDPTSYILEGRIDASSSWVEIHQGDFAWKGVGWNDPLNTRNVKSTNATENVISGTYESGDTNHQYMEVQFPTNSAEYLEYKVSFPTTREAMTNSLKFSLIELPGMLLPPDPSASPTLAPSTSPTVSPSHSPSVRK